MNGFSEILQRIVDQVPGAHGAIFVDWEGEPVGEVAIDLPTLDLQIMGAQWGLVWMELRRSFARAHLGSPSELIVGGPLGSVLLRPVTDQYYVVLSLDRHAHLGRAMSALEAGVEALRAEM